MKKSLALLLALLCMSALLLSACSSSSKYNDNSYAASSAAFAPQIAASAAPASADMYTEEVMEEVAYTDEMGYDELTVPTTGGGSRVNQTFSQPQSDRKIIKHSYLSLETLEFEKALEQILAMIEQKGGYVQSLSSNGQSLQDYSGKGYYDKYAEIQARIPADKLDGTVTELGSLCNITSRSENIEDVSDTYFDTEARLKSLNQQEASLLEILSKAEKLEDVVSLQQALSDVRYQIESLTASLRRMDNQVTYSYLNIDLREVTIYQPINTAPKTFGEEVAAAFTRSGENLRDMGKGIVFFLIEAGPILLIWAAFFGIVALVIVKCVKRSTKKSQERRAAMLAAQAQAQAPAKPEEPKNESNPNP